MALLDNLLTLHRVDSQVRALRGRVDSAKTYLDAQDRQLALLAKQKADLETQERQLQAVIHNLGLESQAIQARVDKLRGELNQSTNDRQYKSILNELKVLETQKDEAAKRELDEMQRAEDTKKRLEVHVATTAERMKVREVAKAKFDECVKDVGDRLAELEAQRERAALAVPERERKVFDKVADETGGESMAEITVVDLRHREFACGNCNIEVPFEVYARLSSNSDAVIQCKACTRILHLAEENRHDPDKRDKAKFEKTRKL
ncbi:MAG: hypothetical protein LW636_04480 [Planctomycetaceae bacterium]|jgi:predicted  nucleic acid-binding Zn-ribbon protein|nr:hypothetical protein [Planctomycetaceae bacterium]